MARVFKVVSKAGKAPEIFLYGDIDSDMARDFVKALAALDDEEVVLVRVNSDGGSVLDGIAMFNAVLAAKCAVDFYIEGMAASMASVIPLAGRNIYINRYARMLTHKPSGGTWGNADEIRAAADAVESLEATLTEMYVTRTGQTEAYVKEHFLNGKDNMFTADQAKAAKLVNDIYEGPRVELKPGSSVRAMYNAFQAKLEAKENEFLNQNVHMDKKEISLALWAKMCERMGITDSASDTALEKAFAKVMDKADAYDDVKAKLDDATAKLDAQKKAAVADKVTALLDGAVTAKKITMAEKALMAVDYAENPAGLEKLLKARPGYQSITDKLHTSAEGELPTEFQGKSWDQLMEAGLMGKMRANHPEEYNALYKKTFGTEPNAK